MATNRSILAFLVIILLFFLFGCGAASPVAGGGGGTGLTTGGGTISGTIFSLIDPAKKNLATPLPNATVVATDASGTPVTLTSAPNGTYTIPGLGGTTTFSAAAIGYTAQTIADVPTTAGQNMNLNPLPTANTLVITASTTIAGTITMASGGVNVPAAFVPVMIDSGTGSNLISGLGTTNASGTYSIPVNFFNNATSGNVTVYAAVNNAGTMTHFGYTTANITTATTALTALNLSPVTTTPVTVTVNNAPITHGTSGQIYYFMKLPTGVLIALGANIGSIGIVPVSCNASAPNNITGVSFVASAYYSASTGATSAGKLNLPVGSVMLNMLNIPISTSPATIAASGPATFTWAAVPGAVQYRINITGTTTVAPVAVNYDWVGIISTTSITKPIFNPANGGNLTAGQTYIATLSASDIVLTAPTTNTVSSLNPLMQAPMNYLTSSGNPNGFVINDPNLLFNNSYAQSWSYFSITAN